MGIYRRDNNMRYNILPPVFKTKKGIIQAFIIGLGFIIEVEYDKNGNCLSKFGNG